MPNCRLNGLNSDGNIGQGDQKLAKKAWSGGRQQ
jgi:hypothetical protein